MNKKRFITRLIGILLFVLCLFILLKVSGIKLEDLSPEYVQDLANDNLFLIFLIMFSVMFIQNLINFFPVVLVMSVNVALFGLWPGFLFSLVCSLVASTIIFISIRYIFKNVKMMASIQKYEDKIEKHGFWFVLIARLIPIMPTNIINMASALSTIKLVTFILATLIGNTIYTLIISSASSQLFSSLS